MDVTMSESLSRPRMRRIWKNKEDSFGSITNNSKWDSFFEPIEAMDCIGKIIHAVKCLRDI